MKFYVSALVGVIIKVICSGSGYVIKSRLKSGNACYLSVQNFLSSSLVSKYINIKMYRTLMLPVFCVGVKHGRSR